MGRFRAFPLMMSLLLLVSCGTGGKERTTEEDLALALQKEYAAMTGCAGRVSLTADYAQRVFSCVLDVTWDDAGGATLTLVEPELVKGVAAHIDRGSASLRYDGFSLETGAVTEDGLSPVEALPTLWRQFTQGYIAGARQEGGTLAVTCRREDGPPGSGLEAVLTFDSQSHAPLTGELYDSGVRVITVAVEEFQAMTVPGRG